MPESSPRSPPTRRWTDTQFTTTQVEFEHSDQAPPSLVPFREVSNGSSSGAQHAPLVTSATTISHARIRPFVTPASDEPRPRGVRFTLWRILNILILVGLGIFKTVETYRAKTAAATVADVVLGLIWAFILLMGSMVEQDNPVAAPWLFTQDLSLHLGREPTASYDRQSHGLSKSLAAIIGALWLVFVSKVFVALSELVGAKEHGFWDIFAAMISCSVTMGGWNRLYSRRFPFRQTAIEFFVGWIFFCIVLHYWTDEPPSFVSPMLGTAWDSLRAANELETIRAATRRPVPILRVRNGGNHRKPIWPGSYTSTSRHQMVS
ncbi:hypothetical protein K438DRAFT_1778542 [Mycena galopus ATCC 62051]|nr:hypothetical protein K438DRAFT_1778542 [Mycena galopus ATCC 62051]